MILETIKAEGLAHLSYLLGDDSAGMCAVIDPRRDVQVYLDLAHKNDVRITHILETHIHADFVSGSRELSSRTGAPIYVGKADEYGFDHQALEDGDTLELGRLTLKTLHTPGHTPEHVCFLVSGGSGSQTPWGLFSGDTLFAGEVGRPDLLGGGSEQKLAHQLFHSLYHKLLQLGDEVEIHPAHGEGSPCGGSIGDRETTTIGYERLNNPRLQIPDEEEFVKAVLSSLPPPPFYYPRMKKINAGGPGLLGCLPDIPPLDAGQFQAEMQKENAIVVDAREIEAFGGAHVPGALNIALRDEFPMWVGWMLKPNQRILLVLADEADLDIVERHFLRTGYENIVGYLRQGMRGWLEAGLPFERTLQMSVHELKDQIDGREGLQLLDVRRQDEWEQGFIPTARHTYAPFLPDHMEEFNRNEPLAVYCGSGYRASIAASLLQRNGFQKVCSIPGSMKAWKNAGYKTVSE
ncbi:MAG: MBL fold metallo-hydrolase [Armatimonadota bacterium]|nr:MBL fold metallo-hydrolase [Armatimonadota bacterium]